MKRAYLVVDMSNDFVDDNGGLTAGAAAQNIVSAILSQLNECVNNNEPVIFCMDAHQPNDAHFELWPKHNVIGTWGAELYDPIKKWYELHKSDNVIILPKPEYDSFYKTELVDILRKYNVDTVLVAGVCTDICVVNTVYGAYKEGLKTIVSKDQCATFTQNHEIFLAHMNSVYKTEII